ncbi:hypothetical protein, partial [Photobacterium halotolerans]|uniref:hypothetical protein n=1 Tax=Photobacterium halotolerans TaxID=265726 RepID=UPI001372F09A
VKEEIQKWKGLVISALDFLDEGEIDKAAKVYSDFKEAITLREKELIKYERINHLTDSEVFLLLPAITEVKLSCKARIGTTNKKKLTETLVDCEDYLEYHLSMINS